MIRLLMGITLSETGGSQRVVFDIISGLPESIYEITLATCPGGELLEWIAELNKSRTYKVNVATTASFKREVSPLHDVKALLFLYSLFRKSKYDVAHFHNSKMGIVGRLAARLAGVRRIYYTVHGWGLNRDTAGRLFGAMSLVEKLVSRLSTAVVFVSGSDMETGRRNGWTGRHAPRLIMNGIAGEPEGRALLRQSLGIGEDLPVLAFVARLTEPKDPLFAIRVSARLAAEGLEHRLVIIGDGPMRADCERLLQEPGLNRCVTMLGQRADVRAILKEADIFCLFTKWEGLPVSIIEAMFAGLPVVASKVGGVPELVRHGVTGYLLDGFDEGGAVSLLAGLMQDKALRQGMGRAGRETALHRFSRDGMVAGYRQLYEDMGENLQLQRRTEWSQPSVE